MPVSNLPPPSLLDDLPVDDDRVLWPGLLELSAQLALLLPGLPVTSPVLVSGDWGSGKTTLLRAVQRHLAAKETPTPTVWFDAWRYEGAGPLLPALMRRIWEQTPDDYRADVRAENRFARIFRAALSIGLKAAPTVLSAVGVPVLPELVKGIPAPSASGAAPAPVDGPPPDPVATLWEDFAALVVEAWRGLTPVVIIDDLDRCSPPGAVSLLDDLRMLVAGAGDLRCKFLVAMDRSVLVAAIASKFSGISDYDGNRYLEKVFPIAFTLPAPQGRDVASLVGSFLGTAEPGSLGTDHKDALSQALSDPLFANPRLMKRCINRFRLVVYFEASAGQSLGPRERAEAVNRDRMLAKWIVATERWPLLRQLLSQQGEEFWRELEKSVTSGNPPPGPEARRLVEDQNALPWLRRELFGSGAARLVAFREADARLRRWGL